MRFRSSGLPNPLLPAAARLYSSFGCSDALLPSFDPQLGTSGNLDAKKMTTDVSVLYFRPGLSLNPD